MTTKTDNDLEVSTKAENDLKIKLYRNYVALRLRLAGDEADLDRRFDKIVTGISQRRQPRDVMWARGLRRTARRTCSTLEWLLTATTTKMAVAGAGAAVIGKATHFAHGLVNIGVAALAGALAATALAVLADPRSLRRRSTARRARSDVSTSSTR